MKPTVEQVKNAAKQACFYVNGYDDYLRMDYCDDDYFCAHDENSGEQYQITYEEARDGYFEKLTKIEL